MAETISPIEMIKHVGGQRMLGHSLASCGAASRETKHDELVGRLHGFI